MRIALGAILGALVLFVWSALAWMVIPWPGEPLRGFEVDDAVRSHIDGAGFGQYFTHRTGHSIGQEVHGSGANMDNFETHDERRVMPWSCFSIEPGVYLPGKFGVRSEVNVFLEQGRAIITPEKYQSDLWVV